MIEFNKKLIFQKFFLDVTIFFALILSSITLIVWIIQAVNFLDFVVEDGHGIIVYLQYTFLNLPKIITRLMPIIFFVSIFYMINKYEDNNELKIYWLTGIHKNSFIKKIVWFSLIFSIFLTILNLIIVPFSQNKARTYIQKSNIDFFPSLISEGKFIDTVENLTIYINTKKNSYQYENIFLKDSGPSITQIIYAKKGELINNEKNRSLSLNDGKIINISNGKITAIDFKTTSFDLSKYLTKSIVDFKISERSTPDLIDCYYNFSILKKIETYYDPVGCNAPAISEIQSELFERFIKPFYLILLALTASYLMIHSKEDRKKNYQRLSIFFYGLCFVLVSEFSVSLSSRSIYYFLVAIILPFAATLIQYYILNLKMRYKN